MGDHFVLLVDRLLTESTLGDAIKSSRKIQEEGDKVDVDGREKSFVRCGGGKLAECRICQDEDDDRNMETPCSCCGSLKYAHRRCVQRWCNEKGNTICEICQEQFRPGYTAPPPLIEFGRIPVNVRGNWEVYRRYANGPHYIAMVSTERSFPHQPPPVHPHHYASVPRSMMCCRSIALAFMLLLVLRHTLPAIMSEEALDLSFPLMTFLPLRIMGIVLPMYIMARVLSAIKRYWLQQVSPSASLSPSSSFSSLNGSSIESL